VRLAVARQVIAACTPVLLTEGERVGAWAYGTGSNEQVVGLTHDSSLSHHIEPLQEPFFVHQLSSMDAYAGHAALLTAVCGGSVEPVMKTASAV